MKKQIFQILGATLVFVIALAAFWTGGIILGGASSDTPAFDRTPEYLLVLGCGLEGEEPGPLLTARIDAAADYLEAHPQCTAVASGGQGADEAISEAEAISQGLQKRGIAKDRILKEEMSTSTYENFLFSKQLLDTLKNGEPYAIAFVTNDFHIYRSRKLAAYAGFLNPSAISAPSSAMEFYPHFVREIAAVWAAQIIY